MKTRVEDEALLPTPDFERKRKKENTVENNDEMKTKGVEDEALLRTPDFERKRKKEITDTKTVEQPTVTKVHELVSEHLNRPQKILMLAVDDNFLVETLEGVLKEKKPGYKLIDTFDDWKNLNLKDLKYCTILISCTTDDSEKGLEEELDKIASDVKEWELQVIILIPKEIYESRKEILGHLNIFSI